MGKEEKESNFEELVEQLEDEDNDVRRQQHMF